MTEVSCVTCGRLEAQHTLLGKGAVQSRRLGESGAAGHRELVIAPARSLLAIGGGLSFPLTHDESARLESSQGWIDSPTRKSGDFHDVEAIAIALTDRAKQAGSGIADLASHGSNTT